MAPQLRALALLAEVGFSVPVNGSSQLPTPVPGEPPQATSHVWAHTHTSKTGILSEHELLTLVAWCTALVLTSHGHTVCILTVEDEESRQ